MLAQLWNFPRQTLLHGSMRAFQMVKNQLHIKPVSKSSFNLSILHDTDALIVTGGMANQGGTLPHYNPLHVLGELDFAQDKKLKLNMAETIVHRAHIGRTLSCYVIVTFTFLYRHDVIHTLPYVTFQRWI